MDWWNMIQKLSCTSNKDPTDLEWENWISEMKNEPKKKNRKQLNVGRGGVKKYFILLAIYGNLSHVLLLLCVVFENFWARGREN